MDGTLIPGLRAYNPCFTNVLFKGQKVTGASAKRIYRRISEKQHELHLQVTSKSLQEIKVGDRAL